MLFLGDKQFNAPDHKKAVIRPVIVKHHEHGLTATLTGSVNEVFVIFVALVVKRTAQSARCARKVPGLNALCMPQMEFQLSTVTFLDRVLNATPQDALISSRAVFYSSASLRFIVSVTPSVMPSPNICEYL